MPIRILLCLCAAALSSCTEYYQTGDQPQMRQEQHTNALGQTTYSYHPDTPPANQ
jgi:hypothetical protein